MDLKEIRQKAEGELQKLLALHREELRDLRFKVNSKQHKDVRDIRSTKKLIAQILTVLKEKHVLKTFSKQAGKEKIKPVV